MTSCNVQETCDWELSTSRQRLVKDFLLIFFLTIPTTAISNLFKTWKTDQLLHIILPPRSPSRSRSFPPVRQLLKGPPNHLGTAWIFLPRFHSGDVACVCVCRGAVADEQTMKTRRWTPVCFAPRPRHPPPPAAPPNPSTPICRQEEQHMWPLSADEHVQCHCQVVRSCPTPRCLGPATALETHTCTHRHAHARTEHRDFPKQDNGSSPDQRNLLYFSWNNSLQLIDSDCTRLNVGYAAQSSSYMLRFFFFFFAPLRYHSQHGWLNAKRPCQTCLETEQTQVSFVAELCPLLPTCRLWRSTWRLFNKRRT